MVGFILENYQVLQIERDSPTTFFVVGKSRISAKISVQSNNLALFFSSVNNRYQLYTRKNIETDKFERCLLELSTGNERLLKPIRLKGQLFATVDGFFNLDTWEFEPGTEQALAYILENERYILKESCQPTKFQVRKLGTTSIETYDLRETLPVFVSQANEHDYLASIDILQKRRLEVFKNINLELLQPFFPFYIAISDVTSVSLRRAHIQSIQSLAELSEVILFALRNNHDLLWNITATCSSVRKFSSVIEVMAQTPRRIYLDVDDFTGTLEQTIESVQSLCQIPFEFFEHSANNGLHLISEPLPTGFTAEEYINVIQNITVKAFLNRIYIDRVSQNPAHFYFFPWIPIIKKAMQSSTLKRLT